MNILLNKNDHFMCSWWIEFLIFSLFFLEDSLNKKSFKTLLNIWPNDQHFFHHKCHYLMINLNQIMTQKLPNFYYMNFKISLLFMETFRISTDIAKEYRKWIFFHKTNIIWWDQMVNIFFKTHLVVLLPYANATY